MVKNTTLNEKSSIYSLLTDVLISVLEGTNAANVFYNKLSRSGYTLTKGRRKFFRELLNSAPVPKEEVESLAKDILTGLKPKSAKKRKKARRFDMKAIKAGQLKQQKQLRDSLDETSRESQRNAIKKFKSGNKASTKGPDASNKPYRPEPIGLGIAPITTSYRVRRQDVKVDKNTLQREPVQTKQLYGPGYSIKGATEHD